MTTIGGISYDAIRDIHVAHPNATGDYVVIPWVGEPIRCEGDYFEVKKQWKKGKSSDK